MRLVLPLDDAAADLASVGGKGASLARLARAGLPVPGGFHVTTEAYRRFVAAFPDGIDPADPERTMALFARRDVPAALAEEIVRACRALGDDVSVAVRSSATAEDLPDLSFAGQQDTFLNVRGDGLLDAVKRCWASLWNAARRRLPRPARRPPRRRRARRRRPGAGGRRRRGHPLHRQPGHRRPRRDGDQRGVGPRRVGRRRPRHAGHGRGLRRRGDRGDDQATRRS